MTMHRAKGSELDDVYIAGWSEGTFPHPDAVSSNLIHEERQLGYGKLIVHLEIVVTSDLCDM